MFGGNYLRIAGYKAKKVTIGAGSTVQVRDDGYQYIIVKNVGTNPAVIVNDGETAGYSLANGDKIELFFGNNEGLYIYSETGTEVEVLEYSLDLVG